MNDRQYLMNGDTVSVRSINILTGQTVMKDVTDFTVISVIGEGGSSVCYEALCENDGTRGRLKEFYPVDVGDEGLYFCLTRGSDNQLTIPSALSTAADDFAAARDDVRDAYCTLARAMNEPYGEVLTNYIPAFELYEGMSADSTCTVYVWTQHDRKVISFREFITHLRESIGSSKNPGRHLYDVLNSVLTLTGCIKVLHTADLLHMDIKPSNFGVCVDGSGQIDSGNISLYDVNTIYSADSGSLRSAGTDGYRAPEVLRGDANCRSDIYSIGATLFSAIIIKDGFDGIYRDEYYSRIEKLVSDSELIRCSDSNQNSNLQSVLVKILQGCLAYDPEKRYKACSYLMEDLASARAYLLPDKMKGLLTETGLEVKVVDVESSADRSTPSGASGAIKRLLYSEPLFLRDKDSEILVLGAGTYAQKFIDQALEVSQTGDTLPRITAVSDNSTDKARYLAARPAFTKFFTVNGKAPTAENLGSLNFITTDSGRLKRSFTKDDPEANAAMIADIMKTGRFGYIFIALGDDGLNAGLAEVCSRSSGVPDSRICFVCYGNEALTEYGRPVYVNEVIEDLEEYEELRRMAFNCHLLWDDSPLKSIRRKKADFNRQFNFDSSLANVLSIKYKLHSLGISTDDPVAAAHKFAELMENDPGDLACRMSLDEHHRWTVNTVCSGWDVLEDVTVLTSDTKDRKQKLHPCLRVSTAAEVLPGKEWTANSHEKWDTATADELALLDPLDRMSVELHRHFCDVAEEARRDPRITGDAEALRQILKDHPTALRAFERLMLSMSSISDSRSSRTELYTYHTDLLKEELSRLPGKSSSDGERLLRSMGEAFLPILRSREYTDFKALDSRLVNGIPFILTYSASIRLCIPFNMSDTANSTLYENTAAGCILDPAVITYVTDTGDYAASPDRFMNALSYAVSCMDTRNLQAKVNLVFTEHTSQSTVDSAFKTALKEMSSRIGSITLIRYSDDAERKSLLGDFLRKNRQNQSRSFTALQKTGSSLSHLIEELCSREGFPICSYDPQTAQLVTEAGCHHFRYVPQHQHLRVSDMFSDTGENTPELRREYEYFWELYTGCGASDGEKNAGWARLCKILRDHTEAEDRIVSVELPSDDPASDTVEEARFILPAFCRGTVEKILRELDLMGSNPTADQHTASSVTVTVKAIPEIITALDTVFADPYRLHDPSAVNITREKNTVHITCDRLTVTGLPIDVLSMNGGRPLKILRQLARDRFLNGYRETEHSVSFCFPFPQIKKLLTSEDHILRLFVYYKALEHSFFDDDALCGDADLILTKGVRSLIVRCISDAPDPETYHDLENICRDFGINAIPVIVTDSVVGTSAVTGNVTVFSRAHLRDPAGIGAVLAHLIE